MQRYIVALQEWLNLWRLTIAAHKCSYTIYLGKLPDLIQDQTLKLTLYGERIPLDHNPKYLGITLDRNLSFGPHVENVRRKCLSLLDILKCLFYIYQYPYSQPQLNTESIDSHSTRHHGLCRVRSLGSHTERSSC